MDRKRYMLFRTVQTVVMLWVALTLLFFMFRLMPGSFTNKMLQAGASPEAVQQFKETWGLNEPLHVQYWNYLVNFAQLNAGESLRFKEPVWNVVQMKLFNSLILIGPAMTFTYVVGTMLGTVAGSNRNSSAERYGIISVIVAGSVPSFFIAVILLVIFSGWLNWFPTSGLVSPGVRQEFNAAPWWRVYTTKSFLMHYILPFSAIVLRYLMLPVLVMRTNVVEVMGQGFTYYHRITGLPKLSQLRHLGKHSILPVITLYPVSMTRAIGGLVLIETVFNWPGIGYTLLQGVLFRDYPLVQFVFFLVAAFIIISNFAVDLVYGYIDPRVSISDS